MPSPKLTYNGYVDGVLVTREHNRLHHRWCEKDEIFFARIDEYGGWPLGHRYVSSAHSEERECIFGNEYLNTGWWTTLFEVDDYYWWKISEARKAKIENETRRRFAQQIRQYV